jgi:hypothetical protein
MVSVPAKFEMDKGFHYAWRESEKSVSEPVPSCELLLDASGLSEKLRPRLSAKSPPKFLTPEPTRAFRWAPVRQPFTDASAVFAAALPGTAGLRE